MSRQPSATVEDYLMEIYDMTRRGRTVIGARLTEKMAVAAPTAWNTIQRMRRDGLVEIGASKEITLTRAGQDAAESIKRRHQLTECLLVNILGLDWADAHEEAHRIEHAISPRVEARIIAVCGDPATCPHGNPLPGVDPGTRPATQPLVESAPGETREIDGIDEEAEENYELMAFYQQHGLVPGARVRVKDVADYASTITVEVDGGRPVTLGVAAAAKVRVVTAPPA